MVSDGAPRLDLEAIALQLHLHNDSAGGRWHEAWRSPTGGDGERDGASASYLLLGPGEVCSWQRNDVTMVWHHLDGDDVEVRVSHDGIGTHDSVLGRVGHPGATPHIVVAPHAWWSIEARDGGALLSVTSIPAVDDAHRHVAPPCWEPGSNMS